MADALTYPQRGANYLRQAGRAEDPHRMLADQVTPRQRRRMFKKERRSWRGDQYRSGNAADWDVIRPGDYGDHDERDYYDDGSYDDPHDLGYCVTPGCNCCGDDDE